MTMWRLPRRALPASLRLALACCAFSIAMFAGDAAAAYRIVELPVPSDAQGGEASDINAAGDVVGHVFDAGNGRHRATVWRAPDHVPYVLKEDRVTYRESEADRINDRGFVLGEMHPRKVGVQTAKVVWGPDDDFVVLAQAQGQQWSRAYDLNDANAVVGTVMPRNGTAAAVAWPNPGGGRLRWLAGTDPGFREGEAYAINDAGMAVGHAHAVGDSDSHAFRWTPREGMRALGTAGSSIAYDVNEAGQAVGVAGSRAVIWESDGSMRDLGGLPGGGADYLQANRINNLGLVIGQTQGSGEITDYVWTSAAGLLRIADAIDPRDPWYARLQSGDARLSARGLNDAGTIVGVLYVSGRLYGIPVMLVSEAQCPLPMVCRVPVVRDSAGRIGVRRGNQRKRGRAV